MMTIINKEFIGQAIKDGTGRLLVSDAELLIKACDVAKAKTIVEIGSFDGGSTIVLGTWAKENGAQLVCIEPKPTAKWEANIKKYGLSNNITLVQKISPLGFYDPAIYHDKIDVLFIDGDHRPTHTITDFIAGAPFLRVGGVWVQHDWCGRAHPHHYEGRSVAKMVREAVDIILADYGDCFEEIGVSEGPDRGAIAFKKIKEMGMNIR